MHIQELIDRAEEFIQGRRLADEVIQTLWNADLETTKIHAIVRDFYQTPTHVCLRAQELRRKKKKIVWRYGPYKTRKAD